MLTVISCRFLYLNLAVYNVHVHAMGKHSSLQVQILPVKHLVACSLFATNGNDTTSSRLQLSVFDLELCQRLLNGALDNGCDVCM